MRDTKNNKEKEKKRKLTRLKTQKGSLGKKLGPKKKKKKPARLKT